MKHLVGLLIKKQSNQASGEGGVLDNDNTITLNCLGLSSFSTRVLACDVEESPITGMHAGSEGEMHGTISRGNVPNLHVPTRDYRLDGPHSRDP